ncbi:hypothetical protein NUACC21_60910 [Scytonema sp. NUACC21]
MFTTVEISDRAEAIVVTGEPDDYIVQPGTGYDGVVQLGIQRVDLPEDRINACTGSLLPTGLHILTAAHCFTQATKDLEGVISENFVTNNAIVTFESPTLSQIFASEFYIHPDWNGKAFDADIAIVKLAKAAPLEADRYDIYRNTDEIGQVTTLVGYGNTGNGNTGEAIPGNFPGTKLYGQNIYEDFLSNLLEKAQQTTPDIISEVAPDNVLAYDFDNGLTVNDAFGYFGFPNLGLGLNEVNTARGDSGGPIFINGLIAGVTSFGLSSSSFGISSDIDSEVNSSFGEFSFDTRVSYYASYIDDVLAGKIVTTYKIPERSTLVGSVFALGALALNSRFEGKAKQKSKSKVFR